jgi:hypothetical protein
MEHTTGRGKPQNGRDTCTRKDPRSWPSATGSGSCARKQPGPRQNSAARSTTSPAASRSPRDQTRPGLTKDRASLPLTSPTTAAYKAGAQPRPGGRGCSGPVAISSGLGTRRGGEGRLEGGESRAEEGIGHFQGQAEA